MNPFYPQKTICYGTACISGSSNQYIHLFLAFLTDEISQQACHETSAYILKSQCRTMKQFQRVNIVLHLHYRSIKTKCIVYNVFQRFGRNIFTEKSISYTISYFLKRKIFYLIIKRLRQSLDGTRHIQTFIACQSTYYSFLKCCVGSLLICTVIFHNSLV